MRKEIIKAIIIIAIAVTYGCTVYNIMIIEINNKEKIMKEEKK